ncbi:MAG: serine/threonine protein phosphatase [Ruminococcaceae bacterium]|nr:serine/threonine protein phosphatase [Oscillospiraceae bacterium]
MALYAMSDLHLSLGVEKPMDVFGNSWHNYMKKIKFQWNKTVGKDDTVIVGGDISWGMYLDEAKEDFAFLNSLPGKKILLRGNHDYWWESLSKLRAFLLKNSFDTIEFLQNDAMVVQEKVVCGTRGWILPQSDGFTGKDRKIYERELIRLSLSLEKGKKISEGREVICVFHFPPLKSDGSLDPSIGEILHKNSVKRCLYGHLHGQVAKSAFEGVSEGIEFRLVSADFLEFTPYNLDF